MAAPHVDACSRLALDPRPPAQDCAAEDDHRHQTDQGHECRPAGDRPLLIQEAVKFSLVHPTAQIFDDTGAEVFKEHLANIDARQKYDELAPAAEDKQRRYLNDDECGKRTGDACEIDECCDSIHGATPGNWWLSGFWAAGELCRYTRAAFVRTAMLLAVGCIAHLAHDNTHGAFAAALLAYDSTAVAVATVGKPQTGGTWRRIDIGRTGAGGWYFSNGTVLRTTGQIWHAWGNRTYLFDPKSNVWQQAGGSIGNRENFGTAYDSTNGAIWIGPGAPVASGQDGLLKYDLATGTYTLFGRGSSADAVIAWHKDTLYAFGGWELYDGAQDLISRTTSPVVGAWSNKRATGTIPLLRQEPSRLTSLRGGIDSRNGQLWVIGDNQELYFWEPVQNRWNLIPTTGNKPAGHSVFTLNEAKNLIVGWAGYDDTVVPGITLVARTWLLDLGTLVWREGPSGKSGPPAAVMVLYVPLYDAVNKRVLLLVSQVDHTEVWQFDPADEVVKLSDQTFVSRKLPGRDLSPFPSGSGSKHVRLLYDGKRQRIVTLGGDFGTTFANDSENPMSFSYDVISNAWSVESTYCHVAGQITPGMPDELPWGYDAKRDRYVALGGILTATDGAVCKTPRGPSGSIFRNGLLAFDPSRTQWQQLKKTTEVSTNALTGQIDPVRDELIVFEDKAGTPTVAHFSLFTGARAKAVNFDVGVTFALARGEGYVSPIVQYDHWAMDVIGRKAYIIAPTPYFRGGKEFRKDARFWRYDLDTGQVDKLPDPPIPQGQVVRYDFTFPVWDSRNRVVIWPHVANPCGVVRGMYVYEPGSSHWTAYPVLQPEGLPVRGNVAIYDPAQNVLLLAGSVFCGDDDPAEAKLGKQTHLFLWRNR